MVKNNVSYFNKKIFFGACFQKNNIVDTLVDECKKCNKYTVVQYNIIIFLTISIKPKVSNKTITLGVLKTT